MVAWYFCPRKKSEIRPYFSYGLVYEHDRT